MEDLKEKFKAIVNDYHASAEVEGEDNKWMSMRNEDIEFLIELAEKYLESQ